MDNTAYVEKIWDFLELGRTRLEKVSNAIANGDTVMVRSCTQDIRIQASGLGLADVAKCAEKLETGAYNCCLTYTITSYNNLNSELASLKKELARIPEAG